MKGGCDDVFMPRIKIDLLLNERTISGKVDPNGFKELLDSGIENKIGIVFTFS